MWRDGRRIFAVWYSTFWLNGWIIISGEQIPARYACLNWRENSGAVESQRRNTGEITFEAWK